ncbi:MAG: phenylalanine--tRNA ligase subunit beta [Acidobacteriota bacterium]
MKLSLDWLSEFVDLADLEPSTVAEELSLRTAEVEGVEAVERAVAGVVAAEVLTCEAVVGEPHLARVKVNLGEREAETVCGAPNVRPGLRVAFAGPGCRLADGSEVAPSTLHGIASEGVLCSAGELGLGTAHEKLLELSAEVAVGEGLEAHCPARDLLVEIDNKSLTHRPDLWGHYGFARELSAIFERPLQTYPVADLADYADLPAVPVEVEDHAECAVYTAFAFDVASNPPSPLKVQRRLSALGTASKNLLVDLSNYIQFELGQPTHAFDAAHVAAGIRVARSAKVYPFRTLDGKDWPLAPEDLLIWSGDRPVAIAGIMGGAGSEIQDDTSRVLLESANFDATRVRRTASRLGLRTDASLRFEKKLPPLTARIAAERFFRLAQEGGAEPVAKSRHVIAGDLRDQPRPLSIAGGYLTRRAGTEITDRRAAAILQGIGFGCEIRPEGGLDIEIPAFRGETDIALPEDISEEVMRLYGYDHIPPQLPIAPLEPVDLNERVRGHHRQRRVLTQVHGFFECHSYAWFDDAWIERLGYRPERPLVLRNPPSEGKARMRDALLPNLFEFVSRNRRMREDFRIFELGRVFRLDEAGRSAEKNRLAGVSVVQSGAVKVDEHLRSLRAAVDDLARLAGLPAFTYRVEDQDLDSWAVAGYCLSVHLGEEEVGRLGVLAPAIRKVVLDGGHAVWFQLDPDRLAGRVFPPRSYRESPVHPGSWQDFTVIWPRRRGYGALAAELDRFAHPLIEGRDFRGVYEPPGGDTANYTFRYSLRAEDRTLTAEDLADFREAIVPFLESIGGLVQ